jgi:hypothetical protein
VTGELQYRYPPHYGDPKYQEIRARRTVLQAALLSAVPKTIIQLRKRLVRIEALPKGGNRLIFDDDSTADADLIVGADGLRSVSHRPSSHLYILITQAVRQSVVPGHKTAWNGEFAFLMGIAKARYHHLAMSCAARSGEAFILGQFDLFSPWAQYQLQMLTRLER